METETGPTKLFERLGDALTGVVPKLVAANANARNEIIDVVSDLAAELNDGLSLVTIYLRSAKQIENKKELQDHLLKGQNELFRYHSEFRICKGLRKLRDRFKRLFDAAPRAVALGKKKEIEILLSELEIDERLIIDEFSSFWDACRESVQRQSIAKTHALIDSEINRTAQKKERIGNMARKIIDSI